MIETKFVRVKLSQVLAFYAKAFKVPDGGKIMTWDAVADTAKDAVVFELLVSLPEKKGKKEV